MNCLQCRRIAAALLWALAAPASAMSCIALGSGGLNIGAYQPLQPAPAEAQTSFAIECFPATPGESLRLNIRLLNAGTGGLQLPNLHNTQGGAQDGSRLQVQLYRDAAHTQPWDDQAVLGFSDRPVVPTRYTVFVYARAPAGQDVAVGQYRLPLTFVFEY